MVVEAAIVFDKIYKFNYIKFVYTSDYKINSRRGRRLVWGEVMQVRKDF